MYEYMSWHVLLARTVSMYCTDCIVPFLHFRRGKLNHMGTVGNGGGGAWGGGGIERVQHPVCTCCSGESRPGAGGGECLLGCM